MIIYIHYWGNVHKLCPAVTLSGYTRHKQSLLVLHVTSTDCSIEKKWIGLKKKKYSLIIILYERKRERKDADADDISN